MSSRQTDCAPVSPKGQAMHIPLFNPATITRPPFISIVGPKLCGKSTAARQLAHYLYTSGLSERSIALKATSKTFETDLHHILDYQKHQEGGLTLIIDDIVSTQLCRKSGVTDLVCNHIPYNISLIFVTQTAYQLSPDIRINVDYLLLFKMGSDISIYKYLFEKYVGGMPSFAAFHQVMSTMNPYRALMCKRNVDEEVSYFMADISCDHTPIAEIADYAVDRRVIEPELKGQLKDITATLQTLAYQISKLSAAINVDERPCHSE